MPIFSRTCFLLALTLALPVSLFGQQSADPCAPPAFKIDKEKNIFNAQQEAWLGEILDEQAVKSYNTVEDPEGDYLQKMGERMLAQLPATERKYRFYIIDAPVNNAFSLGGSRVYVTRQLIAFLKNEDELAGLLGHEIGHIATHQVAIDATRWFRKVLDVQQVGDRSDIYAKWNQFEDTWRKKSSALRDAERGEDEQQIADRIGIYVMTRTGYQPARLAEFFDRLTENKRKTGNFLTDFFGTTNPNSKRVRLLINKAEPLPAQCVAGLSANSPAHFVEWQKAVVGARRLERKEQVTGIVSKVTLRPPLRGSLEYLQFSPDGRYLLAQDESSIFVLSREPLAPLFRIDALGAQWGQFTSDSRSVVFHDDELRVEKWDIETRQRTSVHAVSLPGRCLATSVAPDGKVLACARRRKDDYEVQLIDVATSAVLFTQTIYARSELQLGVGIQYFTARYPRFSMAFSPDSHYFVLGANQSSTLDFKKNQFTDVPGQAIGYDLEAKREIRVPGSIKQIVCTSFVFMGPDRIAGFNPDHPARSSLVRFPSGELISEFPLEINGYQLRGRMIAAPKGPYVLITPAAMQPIAAIDLELKQLAMGYKTPALAIYDKTIAGEELGGRITLYSFADKKPVATVQLPPSPLPGLSASGFSTDGKWLAASGRTSGGIWNVETGERALGSGSFTGGFFDQGQLFATFSKLESKPKIMKLDPAAKTSADVFTIDVPEPEKKDATKHALLWQAGNLLLTQPPGKGRLSIEARDVRTNQVLWTHEFVQFTPMFFYSSAGKTLTLVFESHDSVKAETKNDPSLTQRLATMTGKNFANLIEVLDPGTGKKMGDVLVETGDVSFLPREAITAGDTVLLYDSANRTQVYALKTGAQKGKVLGKFLAISPAGDQMLVENGKGDCNVYDISSLQSLAHFSFQERVIRADFTGGGTLLVLTADQTVYRLQVPTGLENAVVR